MDVSNFYREVFEDTLGLDILGMTDQYREFVELVNRKTLPIFSQYIPCKYYTYVHLDKCMGELIRDEAYNRIGREYYLDDPVIDKFNLQINSVDRVELATGTQFDPEASWYYSSVLTSRQNISLDSILMGAESTYGRNIADFAIPFKHYFEYRGNRVLYLKNFSYNGLAEVSMSVNWPNVASVPMEYHNDLVKLAKLDLQIRCWSNLRYLENVPLPTGGTLDLKFDWASAEQDRDDFLRELKTRSLPDRVGHHGFFHVV